MTEEPDFRYTGWSGEYFDDDYLKLKLDEVLEVGALLLGRLTYEGFASSWLRRKMKSGLLIR